MTQYHCVTVKYMEVGLNSENTSIIVTLTIGTLLIYAVDDRWRRRLKLVIAGQTH